MSEKTTPADTSVEQPDDLVEVMQFPMTFPVKVMGLNVESLPGELADIARARFKNFDEKLTTIEYSRTKKYMAVTLTVVAESREQLDDFYRALVGHANVKVVL